MLKKKMKKFFAFAMALVMTMSVMLSCMSVSAFAVTQSEIDALKSQKSQLASQKSSLQSTINSLQGQQNDQIALKNALDEKNAITVKQILNLNEQIELHTQLIEQKTKEVDEAQKVAELNRQQQQQQQPGNTGNTGSTVGTGNLVWPSYCTYITSRQGPRVHPVTGEFKNHGGTDIGASYGSAIYAADSGTVVRSADGWNGGWGNYVMINHGNGMQTLYAHMSSRAVSVGQTVSRGQTIGYVGSTGMSTGPHLHFEMYINGSRVDPQTRYPGVSFSYSGNA